MSLYRTSVRKLVEVCHDFHGCPCECCGTEYRAIEIVEGQKHVRKFIFDFDHLPIDRVKTRAEQIVNQYWPEWSDTPLEIGDLKCPSILIGS